jgi:MoaA/NifB/PqqE/SkfB family radical SAM enzyme
MKFFNNEQKLRLARSLLTKTRPAYVQFYITARCNMMCEQCNIIYASADCKEVNIYQINAVAENLAKIGVCMVLLIGGEPFLRKDLPEIIEAFTKNDIHVRMQTNGLANEDMLQRCVKAGGHDISVSLDSLSGSLQDEINGNIRNSWRHIIKTVSIINRIFPENGIGFFGTVLMPKNMEHIVDILEFATSIGWGVSLVPVHTTRSAQPLGFRIFDDTGFFHFPASSYARLKEIMEEIKIMRNQGMNLYDSDEYLDDVYRFIVGEPVRWRRRNQNVCDSPSLYFAIQPNGDVQPCCDYKLNKSFPVYDLDFPKWYRSGVIHEEVYKYTKNCDGCMYGSYPEITVSARYFKAMLRRFIFFNTKIKKILKEMNETEMIELASEIFRRNEMKRVENKHAQRL